MDLQRERTIEQIRQNLAVSLDKEVQVIDSSEFLVLRDEDNALYLKIFLEDGSYADAAFDAGESGGGSSAAYEVATESPADGMNDTFTFTGPPTLVFRNGVMETSLGTVAGNTFIFDSNPNLNDVIEGLV